MSTTRISRHINAPRAMVYRALIDPRAVVKWKVPDGMTCLVHEFDAREGGSLRISLTYDNSAGTGKTTAHTDTYHGRFMKLIKDQHIVEVDEFETTDPALSGEMTITITLADADDGTDLLATHEGLPPGVSPADNEAGWQMTLAKLAALVEQQQSGRFATVNGLRMYYEIHGRGKPLVLIHGGGSTLMSTFGRILPEFAKTHQVIGVELQAHGHTPDIDRPLSFEQDADDVAALLNQLGIQQADFMGFSNGGTTCLQIAIRHPELVNKLVLASATYRRDGMQPGFSEGLQHASLDNMSHQLKDAYLEANPDPAGLQRMFSRDVARMVGFEDIHDADIQTIKAPALVLNGDKEVVRVDHALALSRLISQCQLTILPGGHGDYIGEICAGDSGSRLPDLVTAVIEDFLKR